MKRLRPESVSSSSSTTATASKQAKIQSTRDALVDSVVAGDLAMLRAKLSCGMDLSFGGGVLLKTAIEKNQKNIVAFLVREAFVPLNQPSLQNRAMLTAIRSHRWQCVRLLLVLGAEYRDLLEYSELLQLKDTEKKKLRKLVQGFRENYLLKTVRVLLEFTESNANIPGLIMSFLYPLEFKAASST
eukprot:TRINITY_DN62981_c0_g1_i1.p1 TRINITY_DN62981_c0_g1~~TRINITY_DN62981_c0_g1_i1.p1  ORF type:complete len:186 (-),score=52.54 TRINITY_DN62981_c0_g1_i1:183-740(-)